MSKEAMKLALEALEELTVTERTLVDIERGEKAITALREALAERPAHQCWKCGDMDASFQAKCNVPACGMKEQPAQQEPHLFEFWWCEHMPEATQNQAWKAWISAPRHNKVGVAKPEQEPALSCERVECGGSNGCVGHCWKKHKKHGLQQEPVPCCGKYETCTQACTPRGRFLGKREALANEAIEPAPVQQEPVKWGKPTNEMVQAATDEYDEWASDNKGTTECIRAMLAKALKASPPAQRTWVGLTNDEVNNLAAGCHLGNSVQDAIYKAAAKLKDKNK